MFLIFELRPYKKKCHYLLTSKISASLNCLFFPELVNGSTLEEFQAQVCIRLSFTPKIRLVGSPGCWLRNYTSCCLSKSDINFTQIANARVHERHCETSIAPFHVCKPAPHPVPPLCYYHTEERNDIIQHLFFLFSFFFGVTFLKHVCDVRLLIVNKTLTVPVSCFLYSKRNRRERECSLTRSLATATVGVAINKAWTAQPWESSAGLGYIFDQSDGFSDCTCCVNYPKA